MAPPTREYLSSMRAFFDVLLSSLRHQVLSPEAASLISSLVVRQPEVILIGRKRI